VNLGLGGGTLDGWQTTAFIKKMRIRHGVVGETEYGAAVLETSLAPEMRRFESE
jgi:hypothetical protein